MTERQLPAVTTSQVHDLIVIAQEMRASLDGLGPGELHAVSGLIAIAAGVPARDFRGTVERTILGHRTSQALVSDITRYLQSGVTR